jgi:hypothetical protein
MILWIIIVAAIAIPFGIALAVSNTFRRNIGRGLRGAVRFIFVRILRLLRAIGRFIRFIFGWYLVILVALTVLYWIGAALFETKGNPVLLYIAMGLNAVLLLIFAQFSSIVSNIISTNRSMTRNLAIFFLFYSLHIAGLATWTEQYMDYMWAVVGISVLILFFFHGFGIWRGLPPKYGGYVMTAVFVALFISALLKPEVKTVHAKREVDKQKKETALPAYDIEKEYAEEWVPKFPKSDNVAIIDSNFKNIVMTVAKSDVLQVMVSDTLHTAGFPAFKVRKFVGSKLEAEGYLPFWAIDMGSDPGKWANDPPPPPTGPSPTSHASAVPSTSGPAGSVVWVNSKEALITVNPGKTFPTMIMLQLNSRFNYDPDGRGCNYVSATGSYNIPNRGIDLQAYDPSTHLVVQNTSTQVRNIKLYITKGGVI